MHKKKLLTGLQPSGALHIGNYFGALRPFIDTYEEYESLLMVVDYHALTSLKNPQELRKNTLEIVRDYLACGIEPEKVILFKQSDVSEHTELAWILECVVTVPFLMQAHAYKDKVAKGMEANAGLFNYPMLMAADILLYDTDVVPVGEDQRQHLEYAREAVVKFNNAFGEVFKEPKEAILPAVGVVPGVDGKKMSKSYKNTIPLFGTRDEISKAVMSIVTDSMSREDAIKQSQQTGMAVIRGMTAENVFRIHSLYRSENELKSLYEANVGNYKFLKEALVEDIDRFIAPMREKRSSISDREVKKVLENGKEKASALASKKMEAVRKAVGVSS